MALAQLLSARWLFRKAAVQSGPAVAIAVLHKRTIQTASVLQGAQPLEAEDPQPSVPRWEAELGIVRNDWT